MRHSLPALSRRRKGLATWEIFSNLFFLSIVRSRDRGEIIRVRLRPRLTTPSSINHGSRREKSERGRRRNYPRSSLLFSPAKTRFDCFRGVRAERAAEKVGKLLFIHCSFSSTTSATEYRLQPFAASMCCKSAFEGLLIAT